MLIVWVIIIIFMPCQMNQCFISAPMFNSKILGDIREHMMDALAVIT